MKKKISNHGKRFLTQKDMAEAKRLQAIQNSAIKRGDIKECRHQIQPCSCGVEGCLLVY